MQTYYFIDFLGNRHSIVKAKNKQEAIKKNGGIFHAFEFCINAANFEEFKNNLNKIKCQK